MKVRFGRNDVVNTDFLRGAIDELFQTSPMGEWQSNEKLLLFTLLDQATKMSSAEDQATLARLTGTDRQTFIDEINNKIATIGL